ncbi:carbonyl reductase [NADPH] 1-like [Engraulis encrasicolus]|uniref:carbonyl reductase [NADPH] 1-like n=1 Tax=Engraulis encrasicolus TaxID=184585 RepID=UPI002FD31291
MTKKVTVVTGANKGIGLAIVKALCKAGYTGDIILTARNGKLGQEAVQQVKAEGHQNVLFHRLDLCDQSTAEELRKFLENNYGGLDVLINNAGMAYDSLQQGPMDMSSLVKTVHGSYRIYRSACARRLNNPIHHRAPQVLDFVTPPYANIAILNPAQEEIEGQSRLLSEHEEEGGLTQPTQLLNEGALEAPTLVRMYSGRNTKLTKPLCYQHLSHSGGTLVPRTQLRHSGGLLPLGHRLNFTRISGNTFSGNDMAQVPHFLLEKGTLWEFRLQALMLQPTQYGAQPLYMLRYGGGEHHNVVKFIRGLSVANTAQPHTKTTVHYLCFEDSATEPFGEQAEVTMQTNYWGTLAVCKALLPILKPKARVVNVSSFVSKMALDKCSPELQAKFRNPDITEEELGGLIRDFVQAAQKGDHQAKGWPNSAYGTSKIGVTVLSRIQARVLSQTRASDSILLNACCPGWVRTDMAGDKAPKSPEEGAETPVYLALLPDGATEPHGQLVWDKEVREW